jgi:uncharacterized protein (TIGR02466 family)
MYLLTKNIMSISRNDWFPTPIWHFTIDDPQHLNSILLQEVKTEQEGDREGQTISNILGWHSSNNLHKRDTFQDFNQIILANTQEIASFMGWDLRQFSLYITTCWAVVNGKMASNSVHNHPNSILSGVYYLQAPENSGSIYFSDPRPASRMLVPPVAEFNIWNFPKVSYKPYVGTMLMFPSWLMHGVEMNMSDEVRISLSFNIGMSPLVK